MHSAKFNAYAIAALCKAHDIQNVVFSPGSRNAPFVIEFGNDDYFNCCTIPDERVAGFYALGQALHQKVPSIICCTSGTAVLNYAPAVAEAYYQGMPMIVISADRPKEMIDMGLGQSINQSGVFKNYCKVSVDLIQEPNESDHRVNEELIRTALEKATTGKPGPVHINVPFHEPLYDGVEEYNWQPALSENSTSQHDLSPELTEELNSCICQSKKIMILIGQFNYPSLETQKVLNTIIQSQAAVILSEMTSNYVLDGAIEHIDRTLELVDKSNDFRPDLLITIGGAVISKKIKKFLLKSDVNEHWDINPKQGRNTFLSLTKHITSHENEVLELISVNGHSDDYADRWKDINELGIKRHDIHLTKVPFSDLSVFDTTLKALTAPCVLHLGNSTPIRYVQLFPRKDNTLYLSNRGVSGIDGCTSTAIGYATYSDKLNVLVTGDVSFFYDSNAFWIKSLPQNMKIILINNGGGGIFRIIDGPARTKHLEDVFESHHNITAEHLCKMYRIRYHQATSSEELETTLTSVLSSDSIELVEVFTPRLTNADVLNNYFKAISEA